MTQERQPGRGVHHLIPAQLLIEVPHCGEAENFSLVQRYAGKLQKAIDFFHEEYDPWVMELGGESYSEIMAISQHMLLSFIGTAAETDLRSLSTTVFPKAAHLAWRIISAIDDYADDPSQNGEIKDIEDLIDSERTPVKRMIHELVRVSPGDKLTLLLVNKTLQHIHAHEREDLTFAEAVMAKEETTGRITKIFTLTAWPFLLCKFKKEAQALPLKELIQHAVAGSLSAQCLDDLVDVPNDIDDPAASSLVITAARDAEELEIIRADIKAGKPSSVALMLAREMRTPEILERYFTSLLESMPKAPEEMIAYLTHQFYHLQIQRSC